MDFVKGLKYKETAGGVTLAVTKKLTEAGIGVKPIELNVVE